VVEEWTVDELAQRAGLPVRTIREYQTLGLVSPPLRRGRVGIYATAHLARLQLIARLQDRGYSLAGIGDLLRSWRDGGDLGEVLGLAPDQLVHVDEPGAPATVGQLSRVLPAVLADRLDDLVATGVIEACGDDRFCVPSPSLLQLTVDATGAGYSVDRVLTLLAAISAAADGIAAAVVDALAERAEDADPARVAALATRGRGLLAHGAGRLAIHRLGRRLGITDEAAASAAIGQLLRVDA